MYSWYRAKLCKHRIEVSVGWASGASASKVTYKRLVVKVAHGVVDRRGRVGPQAALGHVRGGEGGRRKC